MKSLIRSVSFSSKRLISLSFSSLSASALRFQDDSKCKLLRTRIVLKCKEREGRTNSMEQDPYWGTNRSSASQEKLRILWNLEVHYRIRKSPPPVPILSHNDPVQDSPSQFLKIPFYIILPCTPCNLWKTNTEQQLTLKRKVHMRYPGTESEFRAKIGLPWQNSGGSNGSSRGSSSSSSSSCCSSGSSSSSSSRKGKR